MNKENILHSYLECALWTAEIDSRTIFEVDNRSKETAKKDIAKFLRLANGLFADMTAEQIGHDFWLTRNGHGAGFWDRDIQHGAELTKICKLFKELNVFEGNTISIE
jgi:hypothetical protein